MTYTKSDKKELVKRYKETFTEWRAVRYWDIIHHLRQEFENWLSESLKLSYKTLTGILVQQWMANLTINKRIKSDEAFFFLIELKKHYEQHKEEAHSIEVPIDLESKQ